MLVYAHEQTVLLDSNFVKVKKKVAKWDAFLVEEHHLHKRVYWSATSLKDGAKGYIDKTKFKLETHVAPDPAGAPLLEVAKKYCEPTLVKLINSSKLIEIKILFDGTNHVIKPLTSVRINPKPGKYRYKVAVYSLEPFYAQEVLQPYQIMDLDFYLE